MSSISTEAGARKEAIEPAARDSRSPRVVNIYPLVVVVAAAFAAVTCALFALRYGFWTDEIGAAGPLVSSQSLAQLLYALAFADTVPPVYNALGALAMKLTGTMEFGFRLPSILACAGTVTLIALLGRQVAGAPAGIAAALFAAVCPTVIRYGYDARPYALMVSEVVIIWLFLRHYSRRKWEVQQLWTYAVIASISLMTHYFMVLPLVILTGTYLINADQRGFINARTESSYLRSRLFVVSSLATAAALTAIVGYLLVKIGRTGIKREIYHSDMSLSFFWSYFGTLWQSDLHEIILFHWVEYNAVPLVLALLCLIGLRGRGRRDQIAAVLLLLCGVILMPIVAWSSRNLLSVRFSIFALPAVLLLLGCGIASLWDFGLKRLRKSGLRHRFAGIGSMILAAAVCTILLQNSAFFLQNPYFHEWREISTYLADATRRKENSTVLVSDRTVKRNLLFYSPVDYPVVVASSGQAVSPPGSQWAFCVGEKAANGLRERPLLRVRGTIPIVLASPSAEESTETAHQARLQAQELSVMYGVALEERKYWTAMDIGSAAHRAGEKALSRLAFQIVVEKAPVSPDRGYAFRQLGRLEEAIENYEHWLAVTPHWQQKSYAWLGYADALQEKAKREKTWERAVPEVLRAYQRAVHLDTGTSPTVSQRQYENFLRRYKTSSAPQSE